MRQGRTPTAAEKEQILDAVFAPITEPTPENAELPAVGSTGWVDELERRAAEADDAEAEACRKLRYIEAKRYEIRAEAFREAIQLIRSSSTGLISHTVTERSGARRG